MASTTYNLKNATIMLDDDVISGFGDGDALTIEFNSDTYETTIGADGDVTREKTNDFTATGTLRLKADSKANNVIWQKHKADIDEDGGTFFFSMSSPEFSFSSENSYVMKTPSKTVSRKIGITEWSLYFPEGKPDFPEIV